jgi:lipoprotein-releasing system permease protein
VNSKANFSRPIIRLGIMSVAIGLSVMILSVSIVTGFQEQVREKVIGFGSHIQITGFESNTSQEANPISIHQWFYPSFDSIKGIKHIQVFANKAGIIKTDEQIQGVVLKGIGSDFDWTYFQEKMIEGKPFKVNDSVRTDDVIISKSLAQLLQLKAGDPLRMYFIIHDEMQPRGRKFNISGIYQTGLEEFDKLYVIGDIAHIRKLNKWDDDQVGGFEILIDNFNDIDKIGAKVYDLVDYDLKAQTIKQLQPQIFEWLALHDMNVIIIIALMVIVAGMTMISTLLILILEKTNMIGILKALGSKNRSIRRIFIYNAIYIIGIGLFWGNLIAIILSALQLNFGLFKLNEESYYVSEVPLNFQLLHYLIINLGTLFICTFMLIIPTYIITRISPVKAIRFS